MPADSYTSTTQMKIDDPMFAERIRAGDRSAIGELTTEEICKILEVSSTNLGVLLYRGRNRLRECLEDKGVRRSHGSEL